MLPSKKLTAILEILLRTAPPRQFPVKGVLAPRICFPCWKCGFRLAKANRASEIQAESFGVIHGHTPASGLTFRFV